MAQMTIHFQGRKLELPEGTRIAEVFRREGVPGALAALANRRLRSLDAPLQTATELQAVTLDSSLGHKVYRKTLCFLLEIAARKALPGKKFRIGPSLGNAYLYSTADGSPVGPDDCSKLKKAMTALIQADEPIVSERMYYLQALELFSAPGFEEALLLVQQKNLAEVRVVKCAGQAALDHFILAPTTAAVPLFDLTSEPGGLLLQFPDKKNPSVLGPVERKPLLIQVAEEYRRWGEVLGIPSIPRLNVLASQSKEIGHFIQVAETLQEKKIDQLADQIAQKKDQVKMVLIAGPSSSGKTTFTKKLAIHLQVQGFRPRMLSLDDYFRNREDTPKDENGLYDFESLGALDVETLNAHLVALLEGREVEIPVFDFKTGTRKEKGHPLQMESRDILMIEGIHGLNDALTPLIPRDKKFKIYISALTALNLDDTHRISTTDNRLIRRLVRDYQFRGYSALHTLRQWPAVRRGEDKNIFPFQESADAAFNSALDYELAVLREIAYPLLRTVPPNEPEFVQADYLCAFLDNFIPISAQHVPTFSILREFVGNSGFKY